MFDCPECGGSFGTLEGATMHYVNKEDGYHEDYPDKFRCKVAIDEYNNGETNETVPEDSPGDSPGDSPEAVTDGAGSEYDLPEFDSVEPEPEASGELEDTEPDTQGCCQSPELTGSAGDLFQLDSGDVVRLDAGEQICEHCDTVRQ